MFLRPKMTGLPTEQDAQRARRYLDDYNRTERQLVYIGWALCHRCRWQPREADNLCQHCRTH